MSDDLISKVESLKLMLISHATGGQADHSEYKELRLDLISNTRISKALPRLVHVCRDPGEFWSFIKSKFSGTGSYDQRREYLRNEFDPLLSMLETESRTPSDAGITATVKSVSSAYVQEAWHKALERRSTDPEGAITAARTLLESVCKHILDAAATPYDDSADLPKLYSLAAKQLNLSPIRTDLVLKFCAVKQVALAIYVDSFRDSKSTLADLGIAETRMSDEGARHEYAVAVISKGILFRDEFETAGSIVGKKYVLPGPFPEEINEPPESYQEFVIGTDAAGKPVRHTCDPDKLANYFGKNPEAPHYLTPVFFRRDVLAKYYADPSKYSVEDGYLRCGSLWGLRMDNDHTDIVVVFLGDLGRDLSEAERNYWLSFNIAPEGRKISQTTFKRGFLAQFANPEKPDLVFKHEYNLFNRTFRESSGWEFFLPLHDDDEHFLTGLRLLSKDNQAEFDSQLIALTKVLVDSLNEKEIAKGLKTLVENDKGITKLEKFFGERGAVGYEPHIKFLRVLQDLRSKSAAHRKGSSYEKLIADLQMADEGQQKVFAALLTAASEFIRFLKVLLISEPKT